MSSQNSGKNPKSKKGDNVVDQDNLEIETKIDLLRKNIGTDLGGMQGADSASDLEYSSFEESQNSTLSADEIQKEKNVQKLREEYLREEREREQEKARLKKQELEAKREEALEASKELDRFKDQVTQVDEETGEESFASEEDEKAFNQMLNSYEEDYLSDPELFDDAKKYVENFEKSTEKIKDVIGSVSSNFLVNPIGAMRKGLKTFSDDESSLIEKGASAIESGLSMVDINSVVQNTVFDAAISLSEPEAYKENKELTMAANKPALYKSIKQFDDRIAFLRNEIENTDDFYEREKLKTALGEFKERREYNKQILNGEGASVGSLYEEMFAKNIVDIETLWDKSAAMLSDDESSLDTGKQFAILPNMQKEFRKLALDISDIGYSYEEDYLAPYLKKTGKKVNELTTEDFQKIESDMKKSDVIALRNKILLQDGQSFENLRSFGGRSIVGAGQSFNMITGFYAGGAITKGLKGVLRVSKIANKASIAEKALRASVKTPRKTRLLKALGDATESTISTVTGSYANPMFINQRMEEIGFGWIRDNEDKIIAGSAGSAYAAHKINQYKKEKAKYQKLVDSITPQQVSKMSEEELEQYEATLAMLGKGDSDQEVITFDDMIKTFEKIPPSRIQAHLSGIVEMATEKAAEKYTGKALNKSRILGRKGLSKIGVDKLPMYKKIKDLSKLSKIASQNTAKNLLSNKYISSAHKNYRKISNQISKVRGKVDPYVNTDGGEYVQGLGTEMLEEVFAEVSGTAIDFTMDAVNGNSTLGSLHELKDNILSKDFYADIVGTTVAMKTGFGAGTAGTRLAAMGHSGLTQRKFKKNLKNVEKLNKRIKEFEDLKKTRELTDKESKKLDKLNSRVQVLKTNNKNIKESNSGIGEWSNAIRQRVEEGKSVEKLIKNLKKEEIDQSVVDYLQHFDPSERGLEDNKKKIEELLDEGKTQEAQDLKNYTLSLVMESAINTGKVKNLKKALNQALKNSNSLDTRSLKNLTRLHETADKIERHFENFEDSDRTRLGARILLEQDGYRNKIEDIEEILDANQDDFMFMFNSYKDSGSFDKFFENGLEDLSSFEVAQALKNNTNPFETDDAKFEEFETLRDNLNSDNWNYKDSVIGKFASSTTLKNILERSLEQRRRVFSEVMNPDADTRIAENFLKAFRAEKGHHFQRDLEGDDVIDSFEEKFERRYKEFTKDKPYLNRMDKKKLSILKNRLKSEYLVGAELAERKKAFFEQMKETQKEQETEAKSKKDQEEEITEQERKVKNLQNEIQDDSTSESEETTEDTDGEPDTLFDMSAFETKRKERQNKKKSKKEPPKTDSSQQTIEFNQDPDTEDNNSETPPQNLDDVDNKTSETPESEISDVDEENDGEELESFGFSSDSLDFSNRGGKRHKSEQYKRVLSLVESVAGLLHEKGHSNITFTDIVEYLIATEDSNKQGFLSNGIFPLVLDSYKELHKESGKGEVFEKGEVESIAIKVETALKESDGNVQEARQSLKDDAAENVSKKSLIEIPAQTKKTEKEVKKKEEDLDKEYEKEDELGAAPKLGYLTLAYESYVDEETGEVKRRTTDFSSTLAEKGDTYIDPRPLLNPNNERSGELEQEVVPEEDWGRITFSYGETEIDGERKKTTFKQWVEQKEAENKDFRNTKEFYEHIPIVLSLKGQRVAFVHDQSWFTGYTVKPPFDNDPNSPNYIHPSNAENIPVWKNQIDSDKERNWKTRKALLFSKNPPKKLKYSKASKEGKMAIIDTYSGEQAEKNLIPLNEANPQAELFVQIGANYDAAILNGDLPKGFKEGKKVVVNPEMMEESKKRKSTVGHTFALYRVGTERNKKNEKVETYRAVRLNRSRPNEGDNFAENIDSIMRAVTAHLVLGKNPVKNSVKKSKYYMTPEQAKALEDEAGIYFSDYKELMEYISHFYKVSPEVLAKINKKEIDRRTINLMKKDKSLTKAEAEAEVRNNFYKQGSTDFVALIRVFQTVLEGGHNEAESINILRKSLDQVTDKNSLRKKGATIPILSESGVKEVSYKDFLAEKMFYTNVKAFNMGTESSPAYTANVQPVFTIQDNFEDTETHNKPYSEVKKKEESGETKKRKMPKLQDPSEIVETEDLEGFETEEDLERERKKEEEVLEEEDKENEEAKVKEVKSFLQDFLQTDLDVFYDSDDSLNFEKLAEDFSLNFKGIPNKVAEDFMNFIAKVIIKEAKFRGQINETTLNKIKEVAKQELDNHNESTIDSLNDYIDFLADKENKTAEEEAMLAALIHNKKIYNKVNENFDFLFNKSVENNVKKQTKIDVEQDLTETEEVEKNYSKSAMQESVKSKVTDKLKMLMYGVEVRDKDGNIEYGYGGVPKYMSLDEVYNTMLKTLSVGIDPKANFSFMIKKLEESENPAMQQIVARLRDSDPQLQNQFVANSALHSLTSRFVMVETNADGTIESKLYDTNSSTVMRTVKKTWENNAKSSDLYNANGSINVDKAKEIKKAFIDLPNKFEDTDPEDLKKWLENFGIELHPRTWENLLNVGITSGNTTGTIETMYDTGRTNKRAFSIFRKLTDFLDKAIENPDEYSVEGESIFGDIGGISNAIAKIEAQYNPELISTVFRDSGKSIYTMTPPKFLTDEVAKLLHSEDKDFEYIEEILDYSFSSNSMTLEAIKNDKAFRDFFRAHHISLTALKKRMDKNSKEKNAVNLDVPEFFSFAFSAFADRAMPKFSENLKIGGIKARMSNMIFPTTSDKDTTMALSTIVLDLLSSARNFTFGENGEANGVSSRTLQVLYKQIVETEMKRILDFHNKEVSKNLKSFNDGADLFLSTPGLNTVQIDGQNLVEYLKNNSDKSIEEINKVVKEPVKSFLSELVDSEVEAKMDTIKKFGISKTKKGEKLTILPQEYFNKNKGVDKELDLETPTKKAKLASYDFVINDLLFKAETQKLFSGDPALYYKPAKENRLEKNDSRYKQDVLKYISVVKDSGVNVGKRLAEMIAPGKKIAESEDESYLQIFLKDPEDVTENLEYLGDLFYEGDKMLQELISEYRNSKSEKGARGYLDTIRKKYPELEPYTKIESADAQEYTTVYEHLRVMFGAGKIDKRQYDELIYAYKNGNGFTAAQKEIVMQPMKPVHTGLYNEDGVRRFVYVKSSSIPLLPELTAGKSLDKLRVTMENIEKDNDTLVRASFQTANKVGAVSNPVDYRSEKGLLALEHSVKQSKGKLSGSYPILKLDRRNFRLQQDVPHKSSKTTEDKVSLGTQIFKLLLGNGIMDVEGKVFPHKGELVDAKTLKGEFDKSFGKIIDMQKKNLYSELGVEEGKVNTKSVEFKRRLAELLIREAEERDYDIKSVRGLELKTIEKDGKTIVDFSTPLWLSSDSDRYESLLNSIITNRMMKFKLPGNQFVAASETGFDFVESDDVSQEVKDKIIYTEAFNDKELQATKTKDGKVQKAQVFIESKFKDADGRLIDLFEDYTEDRREGKYIETVDGRLKLKEDMIGEELLNLFSFRTPTSSHVSGSSVEIAGFLPPQSGDMMVVPKNFTTQKGLDFDVDKESAYALNHYTDLDGKIRVVDEAYTQQVREVQEEINSEEPDLSSLIWSNLLESTDASFLISSKDRRLKDISFSNRSSVYLLAMLENEIDSLRKIEKSPGVIDPTSKFLIGAFGSTEENGYSIESLENKAFKIREKLAKSETTIKSKKVFDGILNSLKEDLKSHENPLDREIKSVFNLNAVEKAVDKAKIKVEENNFIRTHLSVYNSTDKEVQKKINSTLSMEYANSQANKIEKLEEKGRESAIIRNIKSEQGVSDGEAYEIYKKKLSYFTTLSHDYQKSKADLGAIGKKAISIYSVAITFASQIQQEIGKDGIEAEYITIGNVKSNSIGGVNASGEGYTTSNMLAEKQNTATDNEKEQVLGRVGVDENSIGVDAHGSLRGFGKDENGNSVMYNLLSQPIVKKFNRELKEASGMFGESTKDKDLFLKFIKAYDSDLKIHKNTLGTWEKDEMGKNIFIPMNLNFPALTGDAMIEGISKGNPESEVQYQALIAYMAIKMEGDSYIGAVSALNNNELGKSNIGATLKYIKLSKIVTNPFKSHLIPLFGEIVDEKSEDTLTFYDMEGEEIYLKPTTPQGKVAVNGIKAFTELFQSSFPFSNSSFLNVLDDILDTKGLDEEFRTAEDYEKIIKEFKKYTFSSNTLSVFKGDPNKKREELMVDTDTNESLAKYLHRIMRSEDGNFKAGLRTLKSNPLVGKHLKFIVGKEADEVSRVQYDNSGSEHIEDSLLYSSLPELAMENLDLPDKNGKPYTTGDLVEELVQYSFLEGGVQEATQFSKYVPVELLSAMSRNGETVNNRLRHLNSQNQQIDFYENFSKRFLRQYFLNNPAEAPFISKKVFKEKPAQGIATLSTKTPSSDIRSFFKVENRRTGKVKLYELTDEKASDKNKNTFYVYKEVETMSTKRISQYNPHGSIYDVKQKYVRDTAEREAEESSFKGAETSRKFFNIALEHGKVSNNVKAVVREFLKYDIDIPLKVKKGLAANATYFDDGRIVLQEEYLTKAPAEDLTKLLLHEMSHALNSELYKKHVVVNADRTATIKENAPQVVVDMFENHKQAVLAVKKEVKEDVYNEVMDALNNYYESKSKGENNSQVINGLKEKFDLRTLNLVYATLNPLETQGNAFNRSVFIELMDKTSYRNETLLDKIKNTYRKFLISLGIKEDSLLEAIFNNTLEMADEANETFEDKIEPGRAEEVPTFSDNTPTIPEFNEQGREVPKDLPNNPETGLGETVGTFSFENSEKSGEITKDQDFFTEENSVSLQNRKTKKGKTLGQLGFSEKELSQLTEEQLNNLINCN